MLNFDFLQKGLGIVSPSHFVYIFQEKYFPRYILLTDQISDNMCTAILCFPGCNVINFEINFIVLIKPFFYMTEKSRQKFKYLQKEKSFQK